MQCSGIRAGKKKLAGNYKRKKPHCQLLTARPDGARLGAYFIIIAFCAFM
jgi:hypothetical protein